jgi:hypothetical protein
MDTPERMPVDVRKQVFIIRCKSKRGEFVSVEESKFTEQAWRDYPEDYAAMSPEIFQATKPIGADGIL